MGRSKAIIARGLGRFSTRFEGAVTRVVTELLEPRRLMSTTYYVSPTAVGRRGGHVGVGPRGRAWPRWTPARTSRATRSSSSTAASGTAS